MNPQYLPPQQFGGPPQGYAPPPQRSPQQFQPPQGSMQMGNQFNENLKPPQSMGPPLNQQPMFNPPPPASQLPPQNFPPTMQPASVNQVAPQQPRPQYNQMPPVLNQHPVQQNYPADSHNLNGMSPGPPQMPPSMMPPPSQNNQFTQPPLAKPGMYPRPPMPGQFPPNNLAGQMQDLNLGPQQQQQFAGGMKPQAQMNGDNLPHMPPPMAPQQQGYLNGQQLKSPTYPSGYPQMPGQPPTLAGGYTPQYQPQTQQRRLDPDQMPSPIMVMQEDEKTRNGVFCTNQKGLVPPLVTTKFTVQDQGNCSPRFVRSTMYNVPITQDLMKQTSIPFGMVISPMAKSVGEEMVPPIVNFGDLGPVRCIRCKAYMSPFMQFIDSGRRFQCFFCKATTDVPSEYFAHLDHTGQRMDRYERAELSLGTYEFIATKDYCRNNTFPNPPAIVFVLDVSYNNMKSGLVHLMCNQMKEIVKNLPVDQGMERSNMRVGFITFDSTVHFYNIKGSLAAPQMMIVGDVQDMFMPLLDGFLCTPDESETVIDALMEQIPTMFGETKETQTVLLPAMLAGLEALKASECCGKLLVFTSSLPTGEAPGKLKNRDDRKLLGTEKERTVLTPQTQAYNQLGQDCVSAGCSVDLFVLNNSYIDIATISQVARLSGGEVYKYTYFQADLDGDRLIQDVITNISRPIAFDAIMRVRTSTGVRPTDFYGHFYMSNTTDMELGSIDCNKAVAVEIKHDDKLTEEEGVYVQVALLYTSCSGQRRLRIMNLSLKTCSQMADLYRSCDLDTIINFFAKQAVFKLLDNNPKAVKDVIVSRSAQILANYRKNCATPSSAGQLILPECMKLLPLYVNCLLKSDALSGGADMTIDDRAFVMQAVMIMDVPDSVKYFYPRLIPLHEVTPDDELADIPAPVRCTIEKMSDTGMYVLENGIHMMLWVGLNLNPEFCQQVFGVPSAAQINADTVRLPELDNSLSLTIRTVIENIKAANHRCMRLTLVKQGEKLEPVFKHFLVEDRGVDGSPSYVDFLCHMHKEIRTILS